MNALARIHQSHVARRAKWAQIAVEDQGIDLRRPQSGATVYIMPWVEPERAEEIVKKILPKPKPIPPRSKPGRFRRIVLRETVPSIARAVGRNYGVRWPLLVGTSKRQSLVRVRFIAIYIVWRITQTLPQGKDRFSLYQIGARFGGRDHSSIWHAIRTVEKRMASDFHYAAKVAAVECSIRRELKGAVHGME